MTPAESAALRQTLRLLESLEPKFVPFAPSQETVFVALDRAQVDILAAMVIAAREQFARAVAELEAEP